MNFKRGNKRIKYLQNLTEINSQKTKEINQNFGKIQKLYRNVSELDLSVQKSKKIYLINKSKNSIEKNKFKQMKKKNNLIEEELKYYKKIISNKKKYLQNKKNNYEKNIKDIYEYGKKKLILDKLILKRKKETKKKKEIFFQKTFQNKKNNNIELLINKYLDNKKIQNIFLEKKIKKIYDIFNLDEPIVNQEYRNIYILQKQNELKKFIDNINFEINLLRKERNKSKKRKLKKIL